MKLKHQIPAEFAETVRELGRLRDAGKVVFKAIRGPCWRSYVNRIVPENLDKDRIDAFVSIDFATICRWHIHAPGSPIGLCGNQKSYTGECNEAGTSDDQPWFCDGRAF